MAKLKEWWAAHHPSKRRLIQLYAALLYNANLKGFISGELYTGATKALCVPGFNCYSCPGAIGACPLGALQNALAASGTRAPYYVLGILALFGLTLGRTVCGWLCPLGLLQELLHKLPTPKIPKSKITRALSWVKYGVLAVFVVAIPLYYSLRYTPLPAFCKYICPAGTLEGAITLLANPANESMFSMLGVFFTRKFVILMAIIVACVFLYRAFCRFLCPLGAIYGLFSRLSLLGVRVEAASCTGCGRCVQHCKMDIRHVGDHECIHCGECLELCPTHAIQWKGKKPMLQANEGAAVATLPRRARGTMLWGCALLLLVGLWAASFMLPAADEAAPVDAAQPEQTTQTENGCEVGMLAPDFTAPLYGAGASGESFHLADTQGKVVVINFWATWCSACCEELPYFMQLQQQYPQDVAVVAVHADTVTDDVQTFLNANGYDSLTAVLDTDGSILRAYGSTGFATVLPITVVLDRQGCIVYNQVGSITYERLQSLVEATR